MKFKLLLLGLMAMVTMSASAQISFRKSGTTRYYNTPIQLRYGSTNMASTFSAGSLVNKGYIDSIQPYRSYTALLTQAGTAAPTDVVLQQDLDTTAIVWARSSAGVYTATLTAGFVTNKTWFSIQNNSGAAVDFVMVRTSANVVTLTTYTGGVATDALLSGTPIEIRVYN